MTQRRDDFDELEDLMAVWQQSVEPIDELREDFVRRTWKTKGLLDGSIAIVTICLFLLIGLALMRQDVMTFLALMTSGPFAVYAIVMMMRFRVLYRTAPPLTPRGYLDTMRLHLDIRRRHHAADQRLFPLVLLLPTVIVVARFVLIGFSWPVLLTFLCVGCPAFAGAGYFSYVRAPRRFADEQARLDALERELEGPSF